MIDFRWSKDHSNRVGFSHHVRKAILSSHGSFGLQIDHWTFVTGVLFAMKEAAMDRGLPGALGKE